jgi:broad specificity polyphosphatase/5'/3'-nucleotidase SurE
MRKRYWTRLSQASAIVVALALLATVAGAANRAADIASGPETISAAVTADLVGSSSVAAAVEKSDKSEKSHADHATTTSGASTNVQVTVHQTDRDNDQDEVGVNLSPQSTPDALTSSARPGWGCGDKNHDHTSGPPGNPTATSPCNKNKP